MFEVDEVVFDGSLVTPVHFMFCLPHLRAWKIPLAMFDEYWYFVENSKLWGFETYVK